MTKKNGDNAAEKGQEELPVEPEDKVKERNKEHVSQMLATFQRQTDEEDALGTDDTGSGEEDELPTELDTSDTIEDTDEPDTGVEGEDEEPDVPTATDEDSSGVEETKESDDTGADESDEDGVDEPVVETGHDEDLVSEMRKRLNEQAREMARLKQQAQQVDVDEEDDQQESTEEPETKKPGKQKVADYQFTPIESEDEFERVVSSRESFNKYMQSVVNGVADHFSNQVQSLNQNNLTRLPELTQQYVDQRIRTNELVRDFYQANPELQEHMDYVSMVADQVGNDNPDKSYEELLPEIAKEAKTRLGLTDGQSNGSRKSSTTKTPRKKPSKREKPAFAGGSKGTGRGGQSSGDGLTERQRQIKEMMP